MKKIYVPMSADVIHHGHINIIEIARQLGRVVVGLMTDKAIASYKRVPLLTYGQRKKVVENIKGVEEVIPQDTLDYTVNLKKLKPDYVIHGTDWRKGIQKGVREKTIKTMEEWGGKVIEPDYTRDISSTQLLEEMLRIGITPKIRLKKLKRLLELKPLVRIIKIQDPQIARIIEKTKTARNGEIREFDGMCYGHSLQALDQIFEVTTKPLIVDGNSRAPVGQLGGVIKVLENLGVSALIIRGDGMENVCNRIAAGKKSKVSDDFMFFTPIRNSVLRKGRDEALQMARAYIKAGADGIMIDSEEETRTETLKFCQRYKQLELKRPLAVLSSLKEVRSEKTLMDAGVGMVVYVDSLLQWDLSQRRTLAKFL